MITKYFGNIPSEWQLVELQEVLHSFQNGYAFSATDYQEEGIPIVSMASIGLDGNFTLNEESAKKWTNSDLQKLSQYILQNGDLIIAMTDVTPEKNLIGRMTILNRNGPFFLNQRVGLLKVDKSKVDAYFLKAFSNFKWWRDYSRATATAGVQANISTIDIKKAPIPLPPLEAQKKIAQILSTWDEAIEAVKELIEKKKTAKRVLHSSIFSENSKSWQKQRLSDVVIILDNKRVPLNSEQRNNMLGNIPYYGANGVVGYVNDYIFDEDLILMAEDGGYFDEYKTRPIAYKITGKAWVNNHAHVLKVREGFDYNFIFHSLEHKNILRFLNGGTRAKLNRGELEKLPIYLPRTYEEQKEIGNLFAFIDEEIELQGDKLVLLKKQKNGLMQRLLTGKVRVSNHD